MKMLGIFLSLLILFCLALNCIGQAGPPQEILSLFAYDSNAPLDFKDRPILKERDFEIHDISYASPKGGRVTAYLVLPGGKGPFAAVLFGHWGYGTRTEFLPEAIAYAQTGAISLLIDYPWVRPEPWRKNIGN